VIAGIPTPFGPSWDDLTLDDLQRFFADAGDEGWTWEAKGTKARPEHVQEAASAFGNSIAGGYLVLGARREDRSGPWIVDGVELPTEPMLWVTSALMNDGVQPIPDYDPKPFDLGNGRHVVVVNIRPASVPPVITKKGHVWERLSSVSRQVTDPATMRRLVERGEWARREAERVTDEAMGSFLGDPGARPSSIVVAMAAAGWTGDVTTKVFRPQVYQLMKDVLEGAPGGTSTFGRDLNQGHLRLWTTEPDVDSVTYGVIDVSRHGSVVAALGRDVVYDGLAAVVDTVRVLEPQWTNAATVLRSFAGDAPAHARVALWHPERGSTDVARWTTTDGPWDEDLASIQREVRRHVGYEDWEP
jgi:hypothetical protein